MVSTVALAILIMQSTYIWNLNNEAIALHVVNFQFVFKDVNNEVIITQDLRSAFTEFYFVSV